MNRNAADSARSGQSAVGSRQKDRPLIYRLPTADCPLPSDVSVAEPALHCDGRNNAVSTQDRPTVLVAVPPVDGPVAGGGLDPLLAPWVGDSDALRAEAALAAALAAADAVIRPIISSRLRQRENEEDREDLRSEIRVKLVSTLQRLRQGRIEPVADFRAYAARVAWNCCNEMLRSRYPERAHLKMKLRYLLSHDVRFAMTEAEPGTLLCGLSRWPQPLAAAADGLPGHSSLRPRGSWTSAPAPFVTSVLEEIGHPIELEELTDAVWKLSAMSAKPAAAPRRMEEGGRDLEIPDARPSPEAETSSREHLKRLWEEIVLLPARQRAALLLNLRDERGASAIEIFPFCGVASVGVLADALGIDMSELAELWPSLPLHDLAIAARLGATRQQVINLRRCARERLARRMKALSRNNAAVSPSAQSRRNHE
jgi:RNA polymerase sigma factor (sigma-70 family)